MSSPTTDRRAPAPADDDGLDSRRVARRASLTAEANAAQRASETLQPEGRRLFDDPFARHFVRRPHYRALSASPRIARASLRLFDRQFPGLQALIMLRARYADEVVVRCAERGTPQVVLLGAGFDSTALRHQGSPLVFYEVDSPTTQQAKRGQLADAGLEPPAGAVYVPCDFERDSVGERLDAGGFDRRQPCLAVWLGVSYYLTERAFRGALSDIAAFSAPGSLLVLDYMDPEVPDGTTNDPAARSWAKAVIRRGEPYRYGVSDAGIRDVLEDAGFDVREQLRLPELARRYAGPGGPWCRVNDFTAIALAERREEPRGDPA